MRFHCEIQARIRDINLGNHVDSVEALRIIDEGRMQFFGIRAAHGMPGLPGVLSGLPEGVGPLVGGHRVEYRAEMRFAPHQPFRLSVWLGRLGTTSFSVCTELFTVGAVPADQPAVIAETAVILWDRGAESAWPIVAGVRETLAEYVEEPVRFRS